jgi:hypothetical protein
MQNTSAPALQTVLDSPSSAKAFYTFHISPSQALLTKHIYNSEEGAEWITGGI